MFLTCFSTLSVSLFDFILDVIFYIYIYVTLFLRFMENLQSEVQEMEFMQFSKGMDTMRREDFAEWLLHYTNEEDNDIYWENMRKKIPAGQVHKNFKKQNAVKTSRSEALK